jgi:hypothetical protein
LNFFLQELKEQIVKWFGILLVSIYSQGERWKRMRALLDKQMLRPMQVSMFSDNFNDVITDFVVHIRNIRKDNMAIEKIDEELFHWSLESKCNLPQF